jgi:hypothetical protein
MIGSIVLNAFGGIVVLDIDHVGERALTAWDFGGKQTGKRWRHICFTPAGRCYFWQGRRRWYLDGTQCV